MASRYWGVGALAHAHSGAHTSVIWVQRRDSCIFCGCKPVLVDGWDHCSPTKDKGSPRYTPSSTD